MSSIKCPNYAFSILKLPKEEILNLNNFLFCHTVLLAVSYYTINTHIIIRKTFIKCLMIIYSITIGDYYLNDFQLKLK